MSDEKSKPGQNQGISDVRYQVTRACNLRCPHCFSGGCDHLLNELTLDEAKEMINELKAAGAKMITLTGGEPLLRKDFVLDIVEHLRDRQLFSRVFTNGILLTKELATKLSERGLNEVQVSIDGLPNTHDSFRGAPNNFDRSVRAIKISADTSLSTYVRLTVHKGNFNEMERLVELLEGLPLDGLRVRPFVAAGRGKEADDHFLNHEQHRIAFGALEDIRKRSTLKIQLLASCFGFLYNRELESDRLANSKRKIGCSCGTTLCAVTPDGGIKPCGYYSIVLGNIREKPFTDIWNTHPFLNSIRNIETLEEPCKSCIYLPICRGGCRASAYETSGRFTASDPICPRNEIDTQTLS